MRIYSLYAKIAASVRSNKVITNFLFGLYPKSNLYGEYWDWTTCMIRNVLKKMNLRNNEILDMGTGPYAILLVFIQKKLNCKKITGVDHLGELISHAENETKNIKLFQSDLFSMINSRFDLIIFNAPYIDSTFGKNLGIFKDQLSRSRWDGGVMGLDTIQKFLGSVSDYLNKNGTCLLGVNNFYIKDELILSSIKQNQLKLISRKSNHLTRSCAYIIKENHKNEKM